jgi:quinoprotein dehydrogenase-associated probable ABC transporter substrate-binding protein
VISASVENRLFAKSFAAIVHWPSSTVCGIASLAFASEPDAVPRAVERSSADWHAAQIVAIEHIAIRRTARSRRDRSAVPGRENTVAMRRATCIVRADVKGLLVLALIVASDRAAASPHRVLRVCADPNNLPFSSRTTPGFENEIADVVARALGASVEYTWWAQRRGFFRNTLKAQLCDVVIGVPVGIGLARTTAPYYRSSYVFVTRADKKLDIHSLDDERLRALTIGVQLVGDDGASAPPVAALAARGIVDNVRGFSVYGDYAKDSPPLDVVRAVEDGTVDVAIAWGPLAGGAASRSRVKLTITPIEQPAESVPLQFSIALGVRHGDTELAAELEQALVARRAEIRRILTRWRVPQLPIAEEKR